VTTKGTKDAQGAEKPSVKAAAEATGAKTKKEPESATTEQPAKPAAKPKTAAARQTAAKPAGQQSAQAGKARAGGKANQAASAGERQITFDTSADRVQVAKQAAADPAILVALVENLSIDARRIRQFSAAALNLLSERNPEMLVASIPQLSDALHRPEAQTRWECLETLTRLVGLDPEACGEALSGAEVSLYDEESGSARLAALRFLTAYGALDARRSVRVWPLIDEAIQCYHGDPEFQDMMVCVIAFAGGRPSKEVRRALAARMEFDSKYNKGVLRKRAAQIIEICNR
jgi:hypothetical protein